MKTRLANLAHEFLGVPYKWGGSDMSGVDCSGLVIACLQSMSVLPEDFDTTAQGLWARYKDNEVVSPKKGVLCFWFRPDGRAYHVAVCWNEHLCISADKGTSEIVTAEQAWERNAFVTLLPINHRRTKPVFVDVFHGEE